MEVDMSYNAESEILSRLGILDSNAQSPRRKDSLPGGSSGRAGAGGRKKLKTRSERDRFVDVNINGEVESSDSDGDEIFDRNALLSSAARKRQSARLSESPACRLFLICVASFATGVSLHASPDAFSAARGASPQTSHLALALSASGMLAGFFVARHAVLRVNSMLLLFSSVSSLAGLAWLLLAGDLPFLLLLVVQGVLIGVVQYVCVSIWACQRRSSVRWLLALFLLSSIAAAATLTLPRHPQGREWIDRGRELGGQMGLNVRRDRRSIAGMQEALDRLNEMRGEGGREGEEAEQPLGGHDGNDTVSEVAVKPKKPSVAQGITEVKTKTDENVEERKKVELEQLEEEKMKAYANATLAPGGNETAVDGVEETKEETTSTTTTSTSTTTTTTTTTATTTTTSPTTTTTTPATVRKEERRETTTLPVQWAYHRDASSSLAASVLLSACALFFLLSLALCCVSFQCGADPRMAKLSDGGSLTRGCRLRLAVFLLVCGAGEALLDSAAADASVMAEWRASEALWWGAALIAGPVLVSFSSAYALLTASLVGSLLLLLSSSHLIASLLVAALPLIRVVVVCLVDSSLQPRPALAVSSLLVPGCVGRVLVGGMGVAGTLGRDDRVGPGVVLAALLVCLVCLVVLSRSAGKAMRLKEIHEYSSSPVPRGREGEGGVLYSSLLDRESSNSEEEEEM